MGYLRLERRGRNRRLTTSPIGEITEKDTPPQQKENHSTNRRTNMKNLQQLNNEELLTEYVEHFHNENAEWNSGYELEILNRMK